MKKPTTTHRFYTVSTDGGDTIFYWHDRGNVFAVGIIIGIILTALFVKVYDRALSINVLLVSALCAISILTILWINNYWRIRINKQLLTLQRGISALSNSGGRKFPIAEIGTISTRTARGPATDDEPLEVIMIQLYNGKKIKLGNAVTHEDAKLFLEDLKPFVITGGKLSEFKLQLNMRLVVELVVMIAGGLLIGVAPVEDLDIIKSAAMKAALSIGGYLIIFYIISQQDHYEDHRFIVFISGLLITMLLSWMIYL